jgi:cysteine desulfurase family protein (TIGR01976 family)
VPYAVSDIRRQFPALNRIHNGQPVAYFDGPGGTQVPQPVVDAVTSYLLHHNANTHWAYPTSHETDAAIAAAREALADFLGASAAEIAFGANMTTLTYHLSRALGRAWGPGDEVVVTELDHHANVDPWRALERERGITVRAVPVRGRGELDLGDFERAIGRSTRLVAVGAASNAVGTATDVAAVIKIAQSHGALTFVDGVHSAAHFLPDVRALGCDFFACSAYKFYGPHIGVMYARESVLAQLDVPKLAPAPDLGPERLETGTQNHEGIAGAAAAVDFLASLGDGSTRRARLISAFAALHERAHGLVSDLVSGLSSLPGVRVYGRPHGPRTPTVGFTVGDRPADDVARELAEDGLFVSSGDFYAATLVERLGVAAQGLVRVGCSCYTTPEEIDRLLRALRRQTG